MRNENRTICDTFGHLVAQVHRLVHCHGYQYVPAHNSIECWSVDYLQSHDQGHENRSHSLPIHRRPVASYVSSNFSSIRSPIWSQTVNPNWCTIWWFQLLQPIVWLWLPLGFHRDYLSLDLQPLPMCFCEKKKKQYELFNSKW